MVSKVAVPAVASQLGVDLFLSVKKYSFFGLAIISMISLSGGDGG